MFHLIVCTFFDAKLAVICIRLFVSPSRIYFPLLLREHPANIDSNEVSKYYFKPKAVPLLIKQIISLTA